MARAPVTNTRLGLWWPIALGLLVGLVVIVSGHVLRGGAVLVASLVAGGVLRLVLPARRVGSLAVRSRTYDVIVLFALAAALAVVLASLNLNPR